jgi:hypothetical protein
MYAIEGMAESEYDYGSGNARHFIKNINIKLNITWTNITSAKTVTGFRFWSNLIDCVVTGGTSAATITTSYDLQMIGFQGCYNLSNCNATIECLTAYSANLYLCCFSYCKYLISCTGRSFTNNKVSRTFWYCDYLHNCNVILYSISGYSCNIIVGYGYCNSVTGCNVIAKVNSDSSSNIISAGFTGFQTCYYLNNCGVNLIVSMSEVKIASNGMSAYETCRYIVNCLFSCDSMWPMDNLSCAFYSCYSLTSCVASVIDATQFGSGIYYAYYYCKTLNSCVAMISGNNSVPILLYASCNGMTYNNGSIAPTPNTVYVYSNNCYVDQNTTTAKVANTAAGGWNIGTVQP